MKYYAIKEVLAYFILHPQRNSSPTTSTPTSSPIYCSPTTSTRLVFRKKKNNLLWANQRRVCSLYPRQIRKQSKRWKRRMIRQCASKNTIDITPQNNQPHPLNKEQQLSSLQRQNTKRSHLKKGTFKLIMRVCLFGLEDWRMVFVCEGHLIVCMSGWF